MSALVKPFNGLRLNNSSSITIKNNVITTKANASIHEMAKSGILKQDASQCLYICEFQHNENVFSGIISLMNTIYADKKIYRHEHTLIEKENIIVASLADARIQINPILLIYESKNIIEKLKESEKQRSPDITFSVSAHSHYRLWAIDDSHAINKMIWELSKIDSFHLADGHHRFAAMRQLATVTGNSNVLSMLVSHKSILSNSYNRIINESGLTLDNLISRLNKNFSISQIDVPLSKPLRYEYYLYVEQKWLKLKIKSDSIEVPNYPPIVIDKYLFKDILNIYDQRQSDKIRFSPGSQTYLELQQRVDNKEGTAALVIPPLEIQDFFTICKQGILLPPHSTFFEPKIVSGMVSYQF